MRILSAHPFAVLLPLIAATTLALLYVIVARPSYTATTSILIDARVKPSVASDPGPAVGFPDAALVESQVKLIASDVVLKRVVSEEKLAEDPDFVAPAPGLRDRLWAMLGLGQKAAPGDQVANALGALARAVTVKRSERTYVMDVDVAANDAQKAARIANAVARAYVADQQEAQAEAAKRDVDFLRVRLEDLQSRVRDADKKVEDYKARNKLSDANGKPVPDQQLNEVTTALGAARARSAEAKARMDQVRRLSQAGKLPASTSDAAKSATLDRLRAQAAEIGRQEANLRTTLGERHPAMIEIQNQSQEVRRRIAEELKRVAETATNDYQTAKAAEGGLERQSDSMKKAVGDNNQTLVQLRELQREADAQRSVYERFLRTRETLRTDAGEQPIGRVIAPAIAPVAPSAPRRAAILSLAFLGGLAAGLGNALLMHAWGARRPVVAAKAPSWFVGWRKGVRERLALRATPKPEQDKPARPPDSAPEPRRRVSPGAVPLAEGATRVEPRQRQGHWQGLAPLPAPDTLAKASDVRAIRGYPWPRASWAGRRVEPANLSGWEIGDDAAQSHEPPARKAVPAGLRVLGALPPLRPAARRGAHWFNRTTAAVSSMEALTAMRDAPDSPFAEAVRAVLTELRERAAADEPQTVLVTARAPRGGVSVLAASLCFAAAAEGDRVLLIEANEDSPVMSRLVSPGASTIPLALKSLRRDAYAVDTAGRGTMMVVPIETDAMNAAKSREKREKSPLTGIRDHFDLVIVDGGVIGEDAATMMASAATDIVVVTPHHQEANESALTLAADLAAPPRKMAGIVHSAAPGPANIAERVA